MINKKIKKAQVTIFVVIGILILIGAGIFFVIKRSSQVPGEKEVIAKASNVPVEFQAINDFVESCISRVGKEGIKQLGLHGGYIDLNRYGIQANAANPTDSSAFLFNAKDPSSGVAYWNYFKSKNKCEQGCQCGSEQPYLHKKDGSPSIEKQIQDYVSDNLADCLSNFSAFKKQGYKITTEGDISATANVLDSNVMFIVEYKVKAKKDSSDFDIDQFISYVPVDLKTTYDLANTLRLAETNFSYMERWTVEQLAGFGLGMNENKLPPIAASELSPGEKPVYWIKQKVKDDITNNMLPLYTPFFSILGTNNYNYNLLGTYYERATIPIQSSQGYSYRNRDVKFNYLKWWPIYFDITGRGVSGQRIGPETASSALLTFIGVKRYNFYYDVSYPILVDIYDPSAFNNEGMHFYVGFESNIRNNKPINCSGPGLTEYAMPSGSLFCNYDQGCANVLIETKDAKTGTALDGVNLFYSSVSESCDEGSTEIKENRAVAETSLPQCVGTGCSLNAVKEGYWSYPITTAVRCDMTSICSQGNVLCNGESLLLNMEPLRNTSIVVMKKKMLKQSQKTWAFSNQAERLLANEYAFISLEKIKENLNEDDFAVAGVFYGNQGPINLLPGLIPGNYQLNINLFYGFPDSKNRKSVTFQKVEECQDTWLGLDQECSDIGPYSFNDTFIEGSSTLNITLTKEMLDNSNNIIFYALSAPDIDTSYNVLDAYDLDEMGKSEQYSAQYKVELKPTVS